MPDLASGAMPADVSKQLAELSSVLDRQIPAKTSTNLLVGSSNVRAFDGFTAKWPLDARRLADPRPQQRREHRRGGPPFDVVAMQEVRRSGQGFLAMMQDLGDRCAFLITDVTEGRRGNDERLAFVYDTGRLKPSGLACELVVAAQEPNDAPGGLVDQFARTPYVVSFARDDTRFTLITLHVLYGDTAANRVPELTAIARWLARWSASKDPWSENLLALGDFNIDRLGDPLYQAFTSTGLQPPAGLNHIPRTIFDDPNAPPTATTSTTRWPGSLRAARSCPCRSSTPAPSTSPTT